ncbi:hypothetical protein [Microvirga arsenatis]|uniref:Uncharacterized protein n=1 Tax=Microvirga arsenatis TaxID=2692265 RepID=A0ABW9YUT9_9HYPH|nr:hypothetical protein [Microvirga arsenatis]NBJ13343.1 hypothetical protein [Microvirga arsenatis]NBJ24127.1 hypothetical protein [Microvirga arsenatis]
MSDIRKQIRAQIITYMAEAKANGLDPYKAARRAFPGTPDNVLILALCDLDSQEEEAW